MESDQCTSEKNFKKDETGKPSSNSKEEENRKNSSTSLFECNICLDNAKDPVVSLCGHLFCWPCIHQWLETRPQNPVCPVCKSEISKEKVVPLYGRGGDRTDPRQKPVPPRPQGQRTEPRTFSNFFGLGGDGERGAAPGGFQFSFGVGAFPFTFFGTSFNLGQHGQRQRQRNAQDDELSYLFLIIGFLFIIWLFVV